MCGVIYFVIQAELLWYAFRSRKDGARVVGNNGWGNVGVWAKLRAGSIYTCVWLSSGMVFRAERFRWLLSSIACRCASLFLFGKGRPLNTNYGVGWLAAAG